MARRVVEAETLMWKFWRAHVEPRKPLWERAMIAYRRSYRHTSKPALVLLKAILVEAPTYFYARHGARLVLGTDQLLHAQVESGPMEMTIDAQLRLEGDDYARGGTPDGCRLQMRRWIMGNWTAWENV